MSTKTAHGNRRIITGHVSSTKMDKTVVVTVVRRFRDKHFHKFVTRRVKYKAHDEQGRCHDGDLVELQESHPYSKTKRWRVVRTLEQAKEVLE
ncbi:MAG TPA: 30S ribosomal protein S17 [Kofleriaceae bacterium]|nr:30S ribosomal protein S17 [Kofleriaceae bacterium]